MGILLVSEIKCGIVVTMKKKTAPTLPVDERIIPDIFSFNYPKSLWVRVLLAIEMILAVLAVFGTLILALLPRTPQTTSIQAQTPGSASTTSAQPQ